MKRMRRIPYIMLVVVLLFGLPVILPRNARAIESNLGCCQDCASAYYSCYMNCNDPECEESCGQDYDSCIVPCEENGDICFHRN